MAKITRKTAQQFAITGAATDVEQFGSFEAGGAVYTVNPVTIMDTTAWGKGWTATQYDGSFAPYFQDRNAVDLVALYQVAYLLQQGLAEWDSATVYFTYSVVQNSGSIYISLQNNNSGNIPPVGSSNSFWQRCAFPTANQAKNPTRTVYASGSGIYTPPSGCMRIFIRLVGGGGGGGSVTSTSHVYTGTTGGNTTFDAVTAGGGTGGQGANSSTVTGTGGTGGTASGGDINFIGGTASTSTGGSAGASSAPGVSKLGGAPTGFSEVFTGNNGIAGPSPSANSGSGGGGAYLSGFSYTATPGSGGAGAYAEKTIYAPLETGYAYLVGLGGTGAPTDLSPSTPVGGNGAAGIIIIDEFYY